MAAPSPGPREVGADPREDKEKEGLWGRSRSLLSVRCEHTPIQAQERSCTGREPGHAPHGNRRYEGINLVCIPGELPQLTSSGKWR